MADVNPIVTDIFNRRIGLDKDGNLVASGVAYTASATVATDGTNATLVTITFKDGLGVAMTVPINFDLWLSDAASGQGVTATTASGNVTDKTAGTTGIVLGTYTAKKALRCQSLAAGTYQLSITDTAKTAFKVCVQAAGKTVVVATLATASYG